tara:strand:- start:28593 stop:29000 length:408 start_codon:yes stop_codon:yes gene_type:complete
MSKFKSICIIDDDPICVFGIRKMIDQVNFFNEIAVYANGLEAIQDFKKKLVENLPLPSTILLDLNMPIMDGWDFLEDFKKIPFEDRKNVRIHIVSSSVDSRDLTKANSYKEVNNFFTKPITKENIDRVIDEIHSS